MAFSVWEIQRTTLQPATHQPSIQLRHCRYIHAHICPRTEIRHAPSLSLCLSGPGTGVPFHWHGPGYSEVIYGRKVCVCVCFCFKSAMKNGVLTVTVCVCVALVPVSSWSGPGVPPQSHHTVVDHTLVPRSGGTQHTAGMYHPTRRGEHTLTCLRKTWTFSLWRTMMRRVCVYIYISLRCCTSQIDGGMQLWI